MYGDKCRDYNDLGGERLKVLLSSNALHHCGRATCVCVRECVCVFSYERASEVNLPLSGAFRVCASSACLSASGARASCQSVCALQPRWLRCSRFLCLCKCPLASFTRASSSSSSSHQTSSSLIPLFFFENHAVC